MPSEIKQAAIDVNSPCNLAGRLHARLSRAVAREELAGIEAQLRTAATAEDVYQYTLQGEKLRAKLQARDAFAVVTVPLDVLMGSAREREAYAASRARNRRNPDVPPRPDLDFLAHVLDHASRRLNHARDHFGDVGVVPGAAYAVSQTGTMVGFALIPFEGFGTPFVALSWASAKVLAVAGQVTALPGAAIKAAGNGVGHVKASVVAKRRARKAAAAFDFNARLQAATVAHLPLPAVAVPEVSTPRRGSLDSAAPPPPPYEHPPAYQRCEASEGVAK